MKVVTIIVGEMKVVTIIVCVIFFSLIAAKDGISLEPKPTCNYSLPSRAIFFNHSGQCDCNSEQCGEPCDSLPYAIECGKSTAVPRPVILTPDSYYVNGSCVCDDLSTTSQSCGTWSYKSNGTCVCGKDSHYVVKCNPKTMAVQLLPCYCIAYDNVSGETFFASCIYNCFNYNSYTETDSAYRKIPRDPSKINACMCDRYNRRGQLCGECKEGYYQPAYSYEIICVQCTYHPYNWALYALAAFGPLTVFYIIILVFRINIAFPPLTAYVQLCQLVTGPTMLRSLNTALFFNSRTSVSQWSMKAIVSVYGIWNLDFFRMLLPPICLPLQGLQVIAIDYAIACYPILLVILTYVLIELHDRNVRVVVWSLKPFRACLAYFGLHQRDMKSSVISTFASFILLSYVKFLNVSSDLLLPTKAYNMNGTSRWCVFNMGIMKYFSMVHLPYALTAIIVSLVFIFLPLLLLLLYPFRWFQRFLYYCRLRSHSLQCFTDAFQGCFTDGTNGTRDCRHFAAAYLALRIIIFFSYSLSKSIFFWLLASLILIIFAFFIIAVKPYKHSVYNKTDALLILSVATWSVSILSLSTSAVLFPNALEFSHGLTFILGAFPLLWTVIAIIYWVIFTRKYPQRLYRRMRAMRQACIHRSEYGSIQGVNSVHLNQGGNQALPGPVCYQLVESASQDH